LERSPDRALLALVQMTSQEVSHYASSHALLVAVLCDLMAVKVLKLEPGQRRSLVLAALSMNVSMAALQNLLATQDQPPDPSQRAQIAGHAKQSADMLRNCGVSDEVWLEAVLHHHDAAPGELLARPVGLQCARMIQRADLFAARLSPRRHRRALSAAAAVQIAYLDEQKQPDEAGMALIKATGLYPPGCLVQLASGELGVVAKRGQTADKPVVAVVVGKSGLPIGVPVLRQTSHASHTVVRSLAPHELNVRLNMSEILNLG
jgi:HD-GYP domain-containing protein (c-di-GMP phosphodiesterase class II)